VATLGEKCDENDECMENVVERLIISSDSSGEDDEDKWRKR
jgi:hypothetical protein